MYVWNTVAYDINSLTILLNINVIFFCFFFFLCKYDGWADCILRLRVPRRGQREMDVAFTWEVDHA